MLNCNKKETEEEVRCIEGQGGNNREVEVQVMGFVRGGENDGSGHKEI